MKTLFRTVTFALLLCIAAVTHAANIRWVGQANDVSQEDTITVANTWAADDTVTIAINNQSLTITIGTDVSTTAVADIIARAINATSATQNLLNDETRTRGGQEIPEFKDVIAEVDGAVVTVKSRVPGVPFETAASTSALTVTESTAGSGTATEALSVSATGKNHFDNADNWEGGSAPSSNDSAVFDAPAPDCLYGLDYSATDDVTLVRKNGYTGHIGLPKLNPLGYSEYRERYLTLEPSASGAPGHEIGVPGPGQASGRTYLDLGSNTPISAQWVRVYDSQAATEDGPAVQIVGGDTVSLEVLKGSVGIGTTQGQTATDIYSIRSSYSSNQASDVSLEIGDNCTFQNVSVVGGTIHINGGRVFLDADCQGSNNVIHLYSGRLTTQNDISLDTINIYNGGYLLARSASIDTITVYGGGTIDFSQVSGASGIIDPIELYEGFTFIDPKGVSLGESFDCNGCSLADGTLILTDNIRAVITAL